MDGQRERRPVREPRRDAGEVDAAREPAGPGSGRLRRFLRLACWSFLLWTGLSLFFATQIIILSGGRASWGQALSFTMPRWYSWGLLAPFVFWVDRRIGAGRTLRVRVAWHVPLGVAITLLSIVMRLVIRPLRGASWPPGIAEFFLERFYWDLLIYAVLAGISIARDQAVHARRREAEAHALTLQATDLERRLVEARLQTLRAQLHPHFLFNALNTISAFTETDPRLARRLMGQLGDLLRASLTHTARPLVTVGEELTFLDDYLAIELARFEGRLTVSVRADDDALGAAVPGFLLQPLVENAIRHGIGPRLSGGHIDVEVARAGSRLRVRVRDNGVGLRAGWQFERDAGVGLRNVASRLEHLYKEHGRLEIATVPTGGVEVRVDLPLQTAPGTPVPAAEATTRA